MTIDLSLIVSSLGQFMSDVEFVKVFFVPACSEIALRYVLPVCWNVTKIINAVVLLMVCRLKYGQESVLEDR